MTPAQQMRAVTLGAGGVAGAAVGLLIYAFWPQPNRAAAPVKTAVEQPVFVESPKPAPSAVALKPASAAPSAMAQAAAPAPAVAPAAPQPGPIAQAETAQGPAVTRGLGPIAAAPAKADPQAQSLFADGVGLLSQGEITAARLLLERSAAAGEARALVALGDSYDPVALTRLGALGIKGDVAKAKDYYDQAVAAGLIEARQRIAGLTNP